MMYSFDEIGLIPSKVSTIKSRKDVNPFYKDGKLPIFASPMTCFLNEYNFYIFNSETTAIEPINKKVTPETRFENSKTHWVALTVKEFKEFLIENKAEDVQRYILIDCAQGHMETLYDLVKEAKSIYKNLTIMIGNIANPKAYLKCCVVGVDYVRIGIGGGSGCTTSTQTGFHTSIPWMLKKIKEYKTSGFPIKLNDKIEGYRDMKLLLKEGKIRTITKIVADGGIDRVDKAIKALALGADYVMYGKQFAACMESCGENKLVNKELFTHYYGQSSELGQLDRFGCIKSHSEGTDIWIKQDNTYSKLCYDFEAVLRSAMSYANAKTLDEFIGKVEWEPQTESEFKSYNK